MSDCQTAKWPRSGRCDNARDIPVSPSAHQPQSHMSARVDRDHRLPLTDRRFSRSSLSIAQCSPSAPAFRHWAAAASACADGDGRSTSSGPAGRPCRPLRWAAVSDCRTRSLPVHERNIRRNETKTGQHRGHSIKQRARREYTLLYMRPPCVRCGGVGFNRTKSQ